jgi:rod shape-determining protein MreD
VSAVAARFPPLLVGALVLHQAVLPDLRLFGVSAEVLLLVAVAAGLTAGPDRGAVTGFVTGLVADLFMHTPFGLSALVYSITGFAVGQFATTILRSTRWVPVLTAAVASAGGVVAFAAAGSVLDQGHVVSGRLVTVAAVVALLNGLLSVLVIPAARWALADREPRALALR